VDAKNLGHYDLPSSVLPLSRLSSSFIPAISC
jgi:hypothetical protein